MTYKLEPGLARITSPVRVIMSGEIKEFESGLAATEAEFDKKWRVVELRAVENVIEIVLEQMDAPIVNPIGEETFF